MAKVCTVEINGEKFSANQGDLLLDAALMSGIELPHDCRSGYCGTCRMRLISGHVFGGVTAEAGTIHACQTRVIADLQLALEETHPVTEVPSTVSDLAAIAPDVMEVCVK